MYQLYPTVTTTQLRDNPSAVYKTAKESPVVVMSRATPKIVCISPDEWNKMARLLEDQEDIIAALKAELAIALGEDSEEEITDFDAFRAEGAMVSDNGSHPEQPTYTEDAEVTRDGIHSKNDDMTSSEAILASSRNWSDIPNAEFNQLLKDVYEQRRIQNIQTEKSKPKSNGPTLAEMFERLRIINEEEPIELEIPPRVNRPVDFSFLEEEDSPLVENDAIIETDNPENLTARSETHAIYL